MFDTAAIAAKSSSCSPTRARTSRSAWTRSWAFPAKRRGMGKIVRAAASRSGRGPDAPELPVAAERGGQHLLARGRLGAELRRDAGRAVHDVVLQPAEPLHFDLHHVAQLDRPRVGR